MVHIRLIYNNAKHLFYNDYFGEYFDRTNNKNEYKKPSNAIRCGKQKLSETVIEDIDQGDFILG